VVRATVFWIALAACGAPAATTATGGLAERLQGTWKARLHVDQPLPFRDRGSARDLSGSVAFVPSTHRRVAAAGVLAYGAYDIDFTPAGFSPASTGETHDAVVKSLGVDSVEIHLDPGDEETSVILRGLVSGDSIVGTWRVAVNRAAGGTGRFTLSR